MSNIEQLQKLCLLHDINIAVAESCTAGLITSNITSMRFIGMLTLGHIFNQKEQQV